MNQTLKKTCTILNHQTNKQKNDKTPTRASIAKKDEH